MLDILDGLPKDERVIIFCQQDRMVNLVASVLSNAGFECDVPIGDEASRILERFERGKGHRILLLRIDSVEAAGHNITIANHAFLVAPTLGSLNDAAAFEAQAIGRIRRYGQNKTCNIVRFVVTHTLDAEILSQQQTSKTVDDLEYSWRTTIAQRPAPPPRKSRQPVSPPKPILLPSRSTTTRSRAFTATRLQELPDFVSGAASSQLESTVHGATLPPAAQQFIAVSQVSEPPSEAPRSDATEAMDEDDEDDSFEPAERSVVRMNSWREEIETPTVRRPAGPLRMLGAATTDSEAENGSGLDGASLPIRNKRLPTTDAASTAKRQRSDVFAESSKFGSSRLREVAAPPSSSQPPPSPQAVTWQPPAIIEDLDALTRGVLFSDFQPD